MSDKSKKTKTSDILITSLKLMAISLVIAGILAAVNEATKDKIAEVERKNQQKILNMSLPGAVFESIDISQFEDFDSSIESIFEAKRGGKPEAYAVIVSCQGFGGEMRLLVVADYASLRVKNVAPVTESETRGIGSKVFEKKILESYQNAAAGIVFSENPAIGVQAVSGATITSEAVREGTNKALFALEQMERSGEYEKEK